MVFYFTHNNGSRTRKKPRDPFIPRNEKKAIPEGTVFQDNLTRWWNKDEFEDKSKQFTVRHDNARPDFIKDYDYFDDYDDDF